jgi:pimeloyl-ACP methyl ester carboxylesterase
MVAMNRALRAPAGSLTSALGGTRRAWRWRGYDIFATEAGQGPLVFLVHGIYAGSSSFEFRKLFPLLARKYRVVAIDLLGSGLSERPNIDYSADLFVDQIVDAVHHFGPDAAALVCSSLGAAFSIRAAAHASLKGRIGSLTAVCPTGLDGVLDEPAKPPGVAITKLFRSPVVGEWLFNGLASRPSLGWFLRNQAYADPASATPEIIDYYWDATHQPGSRFVPAHFVGGALNCGIGEDLPRVDAPILIAWGECAGTVSPIENAPAYVERAADAELATFPISRLLPHEEEPLAFAQRLERFIAERAG